MAAEPRKPADGPPRLILLGTGNANKAREIQAVLALAGILVERWPGELPAVVEDGATFLENARRKALALAAASGAWVLADDSGLEVEALGGRPGVLSHRYAGEPPDDDANNRKLLAELAGVPPERRSARFVCAIVLAGPEGVLVEAEGTCEGRIAASPRGHNDFGYDPVFLYPAYNRTFAEISSTLKSQVSHRGKALKAFVEAYRRIGQPQEDLFERFGRARKEPFPAECRGKEVGGVHLGLLDADVVGALDAYFGKDGTTRRLDPVPLETLKKCAKSLEGAVPQIPVESRPYFRELLDLSKAVLKEIEKGGTA